MTPKEISEYIQALPIEGPCLLMVDCEKVDTQLLAHTVIPKLKYPVVIVPVMGKPSAKLFTKEMLEMALDKLKILDVKREKRCS